MITNWQNWKKGTTRTSIAVFISFLSQVVLCPILRADIIPDNTLGLENSQFNADLVEGGAARGSNLFHSFSEFSIDEGQTVEFSLDDSIATIFTRVTGANMSDILGTLSISEDADFFLINPNGIFIGPNAELDMEGSFLASTADGIEFGEEFLFGTQDPIAPPDSLLVIQPSALIFNQLVPNEISSQGRLEMERGEAFQLVGGKVILENEDTRVRAREGLIELGGLAAPGRVEFSPEGMLQFPENAVRADVDIVNDVELQVDGNDGGSIRIYAHDLTLNDSELDAGLRDQGDTPNSESGDIIIDLTGNLQATNSEISNKLDDDAQGTIGNIVLTVVGDITLDNTEINSEIEGIGSSGDIQISARNLTLMNESKITSGFDDEAGSPNSQSGDIIIDLTGNLQTFSDSEIINQLSEDAQGSIGDIVVTVAGDIDLEDTEIKNLIDEGIGSSGDIQISAHNLNLNGSAIQAENDSEVDDDFDGTLPDIQSGDVIIELTGNLDAFDSDISTELSRGAIGDSGGVLVTVAGDIELDRSDIESELKGDTGENGDVRIYAHNLILMNKSNVGGGYDSRRGTLGRQSGDVIIVLTGDLEAFNKSKIINTLARNAVGGFSGSIDITVDGDIYFRNSQIENELKGIGGTGDTVITAGGELFLDGGQITNRVDDNGGQGDSGDIRIVADSLRFETPVDDDNGDQALISTTTEDTGDAGDIYITVNEFTMNGPVESGSSGITSSSSDNALGDAGSVFITVNGDMLMTDRGKIESIVKGGSVGTGGDVIINAHSLTLIEVSAIKVFNKANGEPGNIEITLTGDLIIDGNSDINASVEGPNAGVENNINTGNVIVNAHAVRLSDNGQIKVFAIEGAGDAGQIEVTADSIEIGTFGSFDPDDLRNSPSGFFSNSEVSNDGDSSGAGGDIVLHVRSLRIGTGGIIDSSSDGDFQGGDIEITAEHIEILDGAQLIASTSAGGQAGSIIITASDELLISGIDPRDDGFIENKADDNNFIVSEDDTIQSGVFTFTEGMGAAGQITIQDDGNGHLDIVIQNEGTVNAEARAQGTSEEAGAMAGTGGDITLQGRSVQLTNNATVDSSTARNARGGDVNITAEQVELLNGGQLVASTSAEGQAGSINVTASEEVLISGIDPTVSEDEPAQSGVFAFTEGMGAAGEIKIQDAGNGHLDIVIQNEGTVNAEARAQDASEAGAMAGAGGDITLQGRLVQLNNGATVDSSTARNARGGDVNITAGQVELLNGGQLVASTSAEGQAGNINVTASDEILISGTAPEDDNITTASDEIPDSRFASESDEVLNSRPVSEADSITVAAAAPISGTAAEDVGDTPPSSGIFTVTEGSGDAGQINIRDSGGSLGLIIQDGGTVSAQAFGQGNAGSIIIDIGAQLTVTDGDIRTDARQSAGGAINISAGNIVLSGDGDILTNVASGADNGGDIVIAAGYLVALDDSDILAFAQDGAGGNITLPIFFGQGFVPSPSGTELADLDMNGRVDINASGQLSSGTITFPDVSFIENNLTELSDVLVNTDTLVASSCIAPVAQGSGRFVVTGRDGLPQQPTAVYLSTLSTGTVRSLPDEAATTQNNNDDDFLTEPQAVYLLSDGRLVMSRDCS